MAAATMLAHTVFFNLVDNSAEGRQRFIEACKRQLAGHPGMVFFAVGCKAEDINSPVSDTDFDVAVQMVFQDKAAHDVYQDSPGHQQFIQEQQNNWRRLRVFDAYVELV